MRKNDYAVRDGDGKPVVGIDIDGTLADYHTHFLRFAEGWIGRRMPDPRDINPGLSLSEFMGISKRTYRQCKLAYRQGGLKRSMPVYEGAHELSVELRKAGAEVWLCTTRPYLRLDNIDPDTRHWLRRNSIQYDHITWGEKKYRDLARYVGVQRIVAVLEDLPELVDQSRGLGIKTYMRAQPYNDIARWSGANEDLVGRISGIPRVHDLEDARERILKDIQNWKEENK